MTRETADLGHHLYEGLHILQDGALQLEKTNKMEEMLKKQSAWKRNYMYIK